MKNCICNRRRNSNYADLSNSFYLKIVDNTIFLWYKNYLEIMNICVNGNMIFSQIGVHYLSDTVVHNTFFVQSFTYPPNHPSKDLAPGCFWIYYFPCRDCANNTAHFHKSQFFINLNFYKYSTMGTSVIFPLFQYMR